MDDHRPCRLSISDGEIELAGPPAALRALSRLLREYAEPVEATITGGVVVQEETAGPLLVSLQDEWPSKAETAEDRTVNRHQHIEYFPGDVYRAPECVPLIIVADRPEAPPTAAATARPQ